MRQTFILLLGVISLNLLAQDIIIPIENNLFLQENNDSILTASAFLSAQYGSESSLFVQGKKDAEKHYKDYGPYAGSFFPSMICPPAGLITSIVISSKPPKEYNLGIPATKKDLRSNPEYFKGYFETATSKKKTRTWAGFGTGTAFFAAGLMMFGYINW